MSRRLLTLPFCLILVSSALSAVPGLDLSVGPYLGVFKPSLETFNDQVLLYVPRPALGSAMEYGLQAKAGLPLVGVGAGINLGHWSNGDEWTEPALGATATDAIEYKIAFTPLEAFADYSLPIVPMVLKGRVGGAIGMAWASFKTDWRRTDNSSGAELGHYSATAKGSTPYLGFNAGLDLVSIPKVTVGCDFGYRMGKVEQLKVKESSEPADVGTIYEYYNHTTGQVIPLPLELNGLYARLVARYHF